MRQKIWLRTFLDKNPALKRFLLQTERLLMPTTVSPFAMVPTVPTDFNQLLHLLRGYELRAMPSGAQTLLSAGCAGSWYFRWIEENYGPVTRHIGLEYYSPKPDDLPPNVEWIANTVGNMKSVKDGEVDLLFSGQNIEHLWPQDIVGFLMESHRALRTGGVLAMDSHNRSITAVQGWSHPEHIIEFTAEDIRTLLHLAGFDVTALRGVWLCRDPKTGASLPFEVITADGPWPALRRIAAARDNPADSFCWWVEAIRADRAPYKAALEQKVAEIYREAWPERTSRLKTVIGTPDTLQGHSAFSVEPKNAGVVMFGPYMPLRAGAYRVTFTLAADCKAIPDKTEVAWCDVFLSKSNRAAVTQHITASQFADDAPIKVSVDFDLDALEFGVQFRMISTGQTNLTVMASVTLDELALC